MQWQADMSGYNAVKITEVGQLAAAAFCIRRAAEIHWNPHASEVKRA